MKQKTQIVREAAIESKRQKELTARATWEYANERDRGNTTRCDGCLAHFDADIEGAYCEECGMELCDHCLSGHLFH